MKHLIKALPTLTLFASSTAHAAEQVIVYRSRTEAEMDAFWWDNPELALWCFAVLGGSVLLFLLISWWNSRRNRW